MYVVSWDKWNRVEAKHALLFFFLIALTACGGEGESSLPPPAEDSSYDYFPHPANWREPAKHGVTALSRFRDGIDSTLGEACENCHGKDLDGGDVGISCRKCHSVFPHPADWVNPESSEFHGLMAVAKGIEKTCWTQCHGTDFSGGLSGRACTSCHELYPHQPENPNLSDYFETANSDLWRSFSVHGAFVQENGAVPQGMCSTNCHGTDYSGGLSEVTCFNCHKPYPHLALSDNWKNDHRAYVNSHGDGSCATQNGCHTNKNFGPSTVVQSCTDFCHQKKK